MKYKSRLPKKYFLFSALCLAGVLCVLSGYFFTANTTHKFHHLTEQLFREEMLSNTLNMHYTLADPKRYGIEDYEVILPGYETQKMAENRSLLVKYLDAFHGLDPSRLSDEDAYTLQLITSYLENSLQQNSFLYYEEPLSPSSGMQSQLPILLAEYTFRSKQDIEDYLKLLDQTDEYLLSLLTYEQEKSEKGLLMAASSIEKVIEQCDTILTENDLKKGTHFLQTTFQERLLDLQNKGLLTESETDAYLHQNDRLLLTVLLPAYTALGDGLLILKDDTKLLSGLAASPQGKDYYKQLLISETGSRRSIEEIKTLLVRQLEKEFKALTSLLAAYDEDSFSSLQASVESGFPFAAADQMLNTLIKCMKGRFPSLSASNSVVPTVHIKYVSENLAEYCAPAFYLTPPLDDTNSNVIYINPQNNPGRLELFTTLAHEGYPGHLYQSVYSNNLLADADCGAVRQLLWYGGYLEGWALYTELLSFDYASHLMEENGCPREAGYIQIEKHSRSLQLCLYSLLDILIHYEDTSYSQIHKTLSGFGITSPASTSAIYEYIAEEPANYPKYYLGYLEILSLKREAVKLWEDAYTDYRFHKFLLDHGPADFSSLSAKLHEAS